MTTAINTANTPANARNFMWELIHALKERGVPGTSGNEGLFFPVDRKDQGQRAAGVPLVFVWRPCLGPNSGHGKFCAITAR